MRSLSAGIALLANLFLPVVLVAGAFLTSSSDDQPPASSPLARLDSGKIPDAEREMGQPKELVAVLGSQRGRHWDGMSAITFSPDGKIIASAGWDKRVCLWDAQTLRRLATLRGHTEMVTSVAFAPNGKMLASGGDNTVRLWDLTANPPRQRSVLLHKEATGVWQVAISPDGKTLASGAFSVRLWDLSKERPIQRAKLPMESGVSALTFAPDSKTLLAASRSQVVLWELGGAMPGRRFTINGGVFSAAIFSPDGRTVACGSLDPVVALWHLGKKPPKEKTTFRIDSERVSSLAFTPDGRTLISGSEDGLVQFWDLGQGRPAKRPLPARVVGSHVAISSDGKTLAAGSYDGTIRVWALNGGKITERVPTTARRKAGECVAFSPDGRAVACGSRDGTVQLWEFGNKEPRERAILQLHKKQVTGVTFSPDGATLASASQDGTVLLWNLKGERLEKKATLQHEAPVWSFAFAPDGKVMATGTSEKVRLWDLTRPQPQVRTVLKMGGSPNSIASICFAADGKTLVACDWNGVAVVWNVAGKDVTKRIVIRKRSSLTSAALTADGKGLALGCLDRRIYLWDLGQAKPAERKSLNVGWVSSVSYSAKGSLLATATGDGQIVVWKYGVQLKAWQLPGGVGAVQFAPDARHLAVVNSNGTVYILRLRR